MSFAGPPTINETRKDFVSLAKTFPNALIKASNYSNFVEAVLNSGKTSNLPHFGGEIGDTWIYGVSSDPYKVAATRALMRDRTACLKTGKCE